MSTCIPQALTVGVIAQRLGVPLHRVLYVVRARSIKPVGWAGNSRVFAESDVQRIASELARIDRDREGAGL